MTPAFIARWRFGLVFLAIALGYCGIIARLYSLHIVEGEKLAQIAAATRQRLEVIKARRGNILDRRGSLLAATRPVIELGIDPVAFRAEDADKLPQLAALIGAPLEEVQKRALANAGDEAPHVRWRKLADAIDDSTYDKVLKLGIRGVYGNRKYERYYPSGKLASHVLGFVNKEGDAVIGVERLMDYYLRGQDGWRETERDGLRQELAQFERREVPRKDGYNVQLTIDLVIQDIVEAEVERIAETYNPEGVVILVSNPYTGEILAMANWPTFDPNEFWKAPMDHLRNRAATDIFEPGSTFKIVPVGAALNEHIAGPFTMIDCGQDRVEYRGRTVRLPSDHKPLGEIPLVEVVGKSSNRGAAQIGIMLGEERLYKYAELFGFGEDTGFEGAGEVDGILHPINKWDGLTISRLPMGHAISATALQVHYAMSAVANGGVLMRPQIIKRVLDPEGDEALSYSERPKRRVLSPEAATILTQMLAKVPTKGGTAPQAEIKGYQVAGKTGTTQKIINGRYSNRQHVATFSGFFPASRPELAITVVVDNGRPPSGGLNYGGITAAPAFKNIAEKLIQYLALEPPQNPAPGSLLAEHPTSK